MKINKNSKFSKCTIRNYWCDQSAKTTKNIVNACDAVILITENYREFKTKKKTNKLNENKTRQTRTITTTMEKKQITQCSQKNRIRWKK